MTQYTGEDGVLAQPDVCAAMVAVQLGLIDEAEKLYAGCGRYDLLNELYQCSGQWDKAVQVTLILTPTLAPTLALTLALALA